MIFFIVDLQNEPKWLVRLANFEILNVVLLLNFIFMYYCSSCAWLTVNYISFRMSGGSSLLTSAKFIIIMEY